MAHTQPQTVLDAILDGLASSITAAIFIFGAAFGLGATYLIIYVVTTFPILGLPKDNPNDAFRPILIICVGSIAYEVYRTGDVVEFRANWQLLSIVGYVRGIAISAIFSLFFRVSASIQNNSRDDKAAVSAATDAQTSVVKDTSAKKDA